MENDEYIEPKSYPQRYKVIHNFEKVIHIGSKINAQKNKESS